MLDEVCRRGDIPKGPGDRLPGSSGSQHELLASKHLDSIGLGMLTAVHQELELGWLDGGKAAAATKKPGESQPCGLRMGLIPLLEALAKLQ